ncbi:MAG: FAD-dependent oxidoreductase [Bacteroidales bacterium]|nr:FAD-dependent oxidoreductase [Bacteroidales bacterium]
MKRKEGIAGQFTPASFRDLTRIVLSQLEKGHFFGIPETLFFSPAPDDPFTLLRYGVNMETPVGVAAGPHTQLAQNIVGAWLCGARYIELKTVQTLDSLDIPKPCIDMQDEGYNCEWSQELSIEDSFDQYLNAWILIHFLRHKYGMPDAGHPGMIFNMSVGYDLKGIMSDKVQWFFSKMTGCGREIGEKTAQVTDLFPEASAIEINPCISRNVTLSTMHGCPPEEIEEIGSYLFNKGYHTTIKLNPTLPGKDAVEKILRKTGFRIEIPAVAFEHDLKYPDAVRIIKKLQKQASAKGLYFGIKLTNTLESVNLKRNLPETEKTVYMSGKALHPVSVALAARISREFNGAIDISFSGGANCFNVAGLLASGLAPVTVCTDLLRPGGYGLLHQYIENIRQSFRDMAVKSMEEFVVKSSADKSATPLVAAGKNLLAYSDSLSENPDYHKKGFFDPDIKSQRPLKTFDCIQAPCTLACPTRQDIPDYLYHTAAGDFGKAFQVILKMNPFPNVTGAVCDHGCQSKCNRMNYDDPLRIREVKRFVAERCKDENIPFQKAAPNGVRVAVIGAGPSGLSCGFFLTLAGFSVSVYETKSLAGGMVSEAIPSFRLSDEAFRNDLKRIEGAGVNIIYNTGIDRNTFEKIRNENRFVYIAVGAQKPKMLHIRGAEGAGMLDPLEFLKNNKKGSGYALETRVAVIGGGNTAMDVARAAWRHMKGKGKVTVLYRRTLREMPADPEEVAAAVNEGIEIIELVAPLEILRAENKITAVVCTRMKLSTADASGRPAPVPVEGSEFEIPADTVIPAIGQNVDLDFIDLPLKQSSSDEPETGIPGLFIGGDAKRGPSTIITAVGDGRKAAEAILREANISARPGLPHGRKPSDYEELMIKRFRKIRQAVPGQDHGISGSSLTVFDEAGAVKEASRCLWCDELCNICTTLCPNFALYPYRVRPVKYIMYKLVKAGNSWRKVPDKPFSVEQEHQILHIGDWCNHCGNCRTFCPTAGAPYLEKPHLFIDYSAFLHSEGAFHYKKNGSSHSLLYNNNGLIETLTEGDAWFYSSGDTEVRFNKSTFDIESFKVVNPHAALQFHKAAEMSVIIEGVKDLLI